MHFDVIWELQEFFIRCSARLIRFFQTYIFDCFYLWVCLLKFSTKLQWVPIFLWECLKKLVGLRLKGCGWVERSKVQGRWWGGCCGILVGDIFIIITNLCQKYHIRDRGGGTGRGTVLAVCLVNFCRLFGDYFWILLKISKCWVGDKFWTLCQTPPPFQKNKKKPTTTEKFPQIFSYSTRTCPKQPKILEFIHVLSTSLEF